jgi:hypothetical protein
MDYKKYSLERLEDCIHDAITTANATPQEIYDAIKNVVSENYYIYKNQTEKCYELLALLHDNGNQILEQVKAHGELWDKEDIEAILHEREYYESGTSLDNVNTTPSVCNKDDKSPECQKAWDDFWEENYYPEEVENHGMPPWGHSDMEYLCNQSKEEEREKCREYNLREAEYYDKRAKLDTKKDKVLKWQLPVEVDGVSGEYYVQFPDDLMAAANIKENELVEWIDNKDGSYILRKVTQTIKMDEC